MHTCTHTHTHTHKHTHKHTHTRTHTRTRTHERVSKEERSCVVQVRNNSSPLECCFFFFLVQKKTVAMRTAAKRIATNTPAAAPMYVHISPRSPMSVREFTTVTVITFLTEYKHRNTQFLRTLNIITTGVKSNEQ